jgi:hypothetical protein
MTPWLTLKRTPEAYIGILSSGEYGFDVRQSLKQGKENMRCAINGSESGR